MTYEYRHVGHVYVDSGQIAIGDPCYTLGHPEDIGDGDLKLARNDKGGWLEDENGNTIIEVDETIGKLNAYSRFCAETLSGDNPWGMVDTGTAFNTSTTHGDGAYKVTLVLDENGIQRGVYIDLDGSEPDITVHEPTISWDDDDTFE